MTQNALSAKLCGMYGKRLKPEDYSKLCQRRSVGDIAAYLKEMPAYKDALSGLDEKMLHRGQLESLINKSRYQDYLKIKKYLPRSAFLLYESLVRKYEIEQILSCLRFICSNRPDEYPSVANDYIMKDTKLNIIKMSQAKTFDDLLEALQGSGYESIVKQFSITDGYSDYTNIEVQLLNRYYGEFFSKTKKNMSKFENERINKLFGTEQDINNIIRIMRLKEFFPNVKNARDYIYKKRYRLGGPSLDALLSAPDKTSLMEIVKTTPYNKLFFGSNYEYLEQAYFYRVKKLAGHIMREQVSGVTAAFAYIELKDIEIRNITNIIEGVRYGVPPEEIGRYLV